VKRYDYDTQMKFAEVRVRNLVARFRGKVTLWDAVNEPMWEPAFKNLPKRQWPHIESIRDIADYVEPVLRWCRDEDPDATFIVNDYGMEQDKTMGDRGPVAADGTVVTAAMQRRRFLALIQELGDRGVPPDAVGLQWHTGGWVDHATQMSIYDEMAGTGVPLHVTEFWAHTDHLTKQGLPADVVEQVRADYVVNHLTCAFSHPAVEGFFFWGMFNDAVKWGRHSSHDPGLVFHRLKDLLKEQWMTRAELRTDSDGRVRFRGFLGSYVMRYALSDAAQSGVRFSVAREDAMPLVLGVAR
jgi:GH35 family endo-1,4-beta-xylanase